VFEVAHLLRVHPETVRRMAARGDLPAFRLGRAHSAPLRFRAESVADYIRGQEIAMEREVAGPAHWRKGRGR